MAIRVPEVNFRLDIPNISALDRVESPEFTIHNIPWIVRTGKKNGEQWLIIYLVCAKKDTSSNWSHVASASVKLISADNRNTIEKHIGPFFFDNARFTHCCCMLQWRHLLNLAKGYVKDDTISLDIQIKVADPNEQNKSELVFEEIEKSCEEGCLTKFRSTVTNVEHLIAVRSPQIMLRNSPWYILISKDPQKRLCVILESANKSPEFSCKVNVLVRIMREGNILNRIETSQIKEMKCYSMMTLQPDVVWSNLLQPQNGFVKNNSIVFEIEIRIEKPKGIDTTAKKRKATASSTESKLFKLECAICLDSFGDQEISFTPCGHVFCTECIQRAIRERKQCPSCNYRVISIQLKRAHLPVYV